MCICDYDKNRIATCEKCVFRFEWGLSEKVGQVAQKHTAQNYQISSYSSQSLRGGIIP